MDFGDFHLKAIVSDFKIAKKYLMGYLLTTILREKNNNYSTCHLGASVAPLHNLFKSSNVIFFFFGYGIAHCLIKCLHYNYMQSVGRI